MTLESSIHPQITHSQPSPPHIKNDSQTEHTSPASKKNYISTTNHNGRTKNTLWAPLHMYSHGQFSGFRLSTNHNVRTKNTLWAPLNMYSHGWFLGFRLSTVKLSSHYSICLGRMEDVVAPWQNTLDKSKAQERPWLYINYFGGIYYNKHF